MGHKRRQPTTAPLSPELFRATWKLLPGDKLIKYSAAEVNTIDVPADARRFLVDAGLPSSAAPCLDFDREKEGPFPTVEQVLAAI